MLQNDVEKELNKLYNKLFNELPEFEKNKDKLFIAGGAIVSLFHFKKPFWDRY